jgi:hypothetical protein
VTHQLDQGPAELRDVVDLEAGCLHEGGRHRGQLVAQREASFGELDEDAPFVGTVAGA